MDKGSIRDSAPSWCLALFKPEGLLSSVSALLSSTIGIHYGHVLLHFETHSQRLKQWVAMGFGFFIIGIILHFTNAIPINKQLYSFSYVCFIAEAAGIVFSDRRLGFFKAILISRMDWNKCNVGVCNGSSGNFATFINGWYYKDPENSLNDVAACCNWYWIIFSLKINDWENNQIATSTIMTIF
ncbi:uncharacterized protein LOC107991323 [Cucumis melo]|uniref:Uncharacterized protein LOC107991323 n=1 Tax=Cucumis melo TaxID=3656 RepID=A0A1S4E0Y1_CUCME|nr:uncharacterized protein LOC107991323 [Cucumis melo]